MHRSALIAALAIVAASCGSTARPTAAAPEVTRARGWETVFADDFDGASLDPTKWSSCYWWSTTNCTNAANHELQVYTPDNVSFDDDSLVLTARRRNTVFDGRNHAYTSGLVSGSAPDGTLFGFRYGYVEARARVPRGAGLWSALWLLDAGRTPLPEIDVFEVVGETPDLAYTAVHVADDRGERRRLRQRSRTADLSDGFHVFGLLWQPGELRWYVDGREEWRVDDPAFVPATDMYLIANLAVGGDFPTEVRSDTPFPSSYEVDYIRVWQRR